MGGPVPRRVPYDVDTWNVDDTTLFLEDAGVPAGFLTVTGVALQREVLHPGPRVHGLDLAVVCQDVWRHGWYYYGRLAVRVCCAPVARALHMGFPVLPGYYWLLGSWVLSDSCGPPICSLQRLAACFVLCASRPACSLHWCVLVPMFRTLLVLAEAGRCTVANLRLGIRRW